MVLAVYSALLLGTLVGGAPWWLFRMATSGRYRAGLLGRLGKIPSALRTPRGAAERRLVWLHAVSVGEVLAASGLVHEFVASGFSVVVSTTTQTGQELARQRFPASPIFYMPLDFAVLMRRYLRVLRPCLVVTMESELWPNLIHACRRRGVPLAVANARISDRSFPRYLRLRRLWLPLLNQVAVFLAQTEETANRLRRIGVAPDRIAVTGNLKYDIRSGPMSSAAHAIVTGLARRPLVIAGSTVPDEEKLLVQNWGTVLAGVPDAVLLLAPRHTARCDELAAWLASAGFGVLRWSVLLQEGPRPVPLGSILLLDTIGDLASLYAAAQVAFIGGSLAPRGGHNPLEPAQFGIPVLMGPSFENFRQIVEAMQQSQAIQIVKPEHLGQSLLATLEDRETAQGMGERGRQFFEAKAGATARTMRTLLTLAGGNP